jgi:hypothetical protein
MSLVHVVAVLNDGTLIHTKLDSNGSWQPFGYVMAQTGPLPAGSGFASVSCTVDPSNGDLHVFGVTLGDPLVLHTIRSGTDGSWQQWVNVSEAAKRGPAAAPTFFLADLGAAVAFSPTSV